MHYSAPIENDHPRWCLITGSGRGLGAAMALNLAGPKIGLVLHYHQSAEAAETIAAQCRDRGSDVHLMSADLSRSEDIRGLLAELVRRELSPAWLINNAGVDSVNPIDTCDDVEWERVMAINLRAPFMLCRHLIPDMIRRHYGRIINIASVWGLHGASCESIYAASKGGLIAFSRSLAMELGPSGITVNCIAPGPIETDMLRSELDSMELAELAQVIPAGRLGRPEEVAMACRYLLSDEAAYMNGQVLVLDGGWKV